ncbi:MAG TPA: PASTA domain-containing protein [Longimicrobiales bacterium]
MNKILIGLGVLLGTFGLGYLVATRILFPPLPEPEDGIIVPNLSGVVLAEADRQLRPLGLQRGDMIEVAHPSQPPGIIVAQSPLPGQQLRSGGVVRVAISGGLPKVQVPNVIGFDVERATNVLSQLGLSADKRTEQNDRPAGTVIRISPEPGMSQPVPARVVLFVSTGPPPAPPDSVRVPQPIPTPPAPPPADTTAPPDTLTLKAGNY